MIIYLLSVVWILFCEISIKSRDIVLTDYGKERYVRRMHAFVAVFFLVFFIGLRSAGYDTAAYIINYNALPTGLLNIINSFSKSEGLFRAFGIFVKTYISGNYTPYLFLIALISGFAVANTYRKYTPYFTSAMVLFILSGAYIWMINGIRQFLAAALAFSAADLLIKKKTIKFIILVLVLSSIHTSAILLIPIYFCVTGKSFSKKTWIMLGIAVFAVIFTGQFLNLLDSALKNTSYSGIMESEMWQSDDGSNILRTIILAVPVVLSFLDKKNIVNSAPPIICLCVNMSMLAVCFSMIANVTSGIFIGRITIYFSLYNYILLPWLINNSNRFKNTVVLKFLMYICYCAYFFLDGSTYYASDLLNLYIY